LYDLGSRLSQSTYRGRASTPFLHPTVSLIFCQDQWLRMPTPITSTTQICTSLSSVSVRFTCVYGRVVSLVRIRPFSVRCDGGGSHCSDCLTFCVSLDLYPLLAPSPTELHSSSYFPPTHILLSFVDLKSPPLRSSECPPFRHPVIEVKCCHLSFFFPKLKNENFLTYLFPFGCDRFSRHSRLLMPPLPSVTRAPSCHPKSC